MAEGQVVSGCAALYLLCPDAVDVVEVGTKNGGVLRYLCEPVSRVVGIDPGVNALYFLD